MTERDQAQLSIVSTYSADLVPVWINYATCHDSSSGRVLSKGVLERPPKEMGTSLDTCAQQ